VPAEIYNLDQELEFEEDARNEYHLKMGKLN